MKDNTKIFIIFLILVLIGLFTGYKDKARVNASLEPRYTIKITTQNGNKITYWGLGYKVIRYPGVSPKEQFDSSIGVRFGTWFMRYDRYEYQKITE